MPGTPLIPKIPPIRTDIQEPQQSSAINRPPAQGASNGANTASNGSAPQHRTSKEWYYYWSKVGEQVVQNTQTLGNLVTYGPHAGRPDPSTMPDGALAVESDRGVIYQNEIIQGVPTWRYVTGTMWGTLSPDQRPADLGVNDAGFDFRTTDEPAREFIWSQAYWVEATPARYGTHAARLAVDVTRVIEQMLWVETDRTVLYQLMQVSGPTPVWQYIAGTMWGTLSPDQRPTDLGVHDAGFVFRGTDQARSFVWSQAAWVETTGITGPLTNVNVVTRVTGPGQIGEGGITDASAADSGRIQINAGGQVGIGGVPVSTAGLAVHGPSGGVSVRATDDVNSTLTISHPSGALAAISVPGGTLELLASSAGGTSARLTDNVNSTLTISHPSAAVAQIQVPSGVLALAGSVSMPNLPNGNPGAGTKQLWYNPATGQVMFAA